jgi:hypothetical protein
MDYQESRDQQGLVKWFSIAAKGLGVSHSSLLFAIPNGGRRSPIEASRLIREGVRPGVPDLFLAVPRGCFHGLFIEMKTKRGCVSVFQRSMMALLCAQAFRCEIARSFDEARILIESYLKS